MGAVLPKTGIWAVPPGSLESEQNRMSCTAGQRVQNGVIQLDVMANLSTFSLLTDPLKETP